MVVTTSAQNAPMSIPDIQGIPTKGYETLCNNDKAEYIARLIQEEVEDTFVKDDPERWKDYTTRFSSNEDENAVPLSKDFALELAKILEVDHNSSFIDLDMQKIELIVTSTTWYIG